MYTGWRNADAMSLGVFLLADRYKMNEEEVRTQREGIRRLCTFGPDKTNDGVHRRHGAVATGIWLQQ